MNRPWNTTEIDLRSGVCFRLHHYVEVIDYVVADKHTYRETRGILHQAPIELIFGYWDARDYFLAFLI